MIASGDRTGPGAEAAGPAPAPPTVKETAPATG